jgi:hypothetical protein
MTRYLIQLSLMILAFLYAWIRGAAPERAAAAVVGSMFLLDPAYHAIWGQVTVYQEVNLGHLVIDLWLLGALLALALKANRIWPLWLVSVQIIAVIGHFLRWFSTAIDPLVYALFTRNTSYLQIALLFVGTALYRHHLRRDPNMASWRKF